MAAVVTAHSDFGAQENKICHCFPLLFTWKWWHWMPWSKVFECLVLSQAFHFPSFTLIKRIFNSSSFLQLEWYYLFIWGYWYFSQQSWLQLVIHAVWYCTWCTLHIFLGFKITGHCECNHEMKRNLLLERKAMTNLDSILKNKDINLLTKVHIVKAMVFSVVMNGWGNWTKETKKRRLKPEELIPSICGAG